MPLFGGSADELGCGVVEVAVGRQRRMDSTGGPMHALRSWRVGGWRAKNLLVVALCLLVGCTSSGPAVSVTASVGTTSTPGTPLPSETICAQSVPTSSHEQRPENSTANASMPTAEQISGLTAWGAALNFLPGADDLRRRITGTYTGTTDMIIQWVACVWGIDPDIVRAQAYKESMWDQSATGDATTDLVLCPTDAARDGDACYQSYGLLQVKWYYNRSAWPMMRDDTAFGLEYAYGLIRACYEGLERWLGFGGTNYKAGDLWGCLGAWYSGGWHNADANAYIASVQRILAQHPWTDSDF